MAFTRGEAEGEERDEPMGLKGERKEEEDQIHSVIAFGEYNLIPYP